MVRYLTSQGLEKFKKELEYLEKVKRKEVSERLRQTASQGDLSENAGYHAAKEQQAFVEGRIKELKEILSQAKIVEKKESDRVQIGCLVCLKSLKEAKASFRPSSLKRDLVGEETFQVVGPEEADILQGKISFKSPLGEAIFKKKKGDIVEINTLQGKKKYEIIDIK